jgi:enoyl-CoA hydratase/carnithine racemase
MATIAEEMADEYADAFAFRSKDDRYITISRHAKPDFCAGMTIEEILEHYDVVAIYFDKRG